MNSAQFKVELFAPYKVPLGAEFPIFLSIENNLSTAEKFSLVIYLQENFLLEGSTSTVLEVRGVAISIY